MENRFYVYVYLDQRKPGKWVYKDKVFDYQPFYVGKGTKHRDTSHLCPYMLARKSHKSSTIKAIINDMGELPIHIRIYEYITEMESVEIEKDFIKTFGRTDLGEGILCNHTDGGDGANNLSLETKRKIGYASRKRVYQYSMGGDFMRMWNSLTEVGDEMGINVANIPTAIKRSGSCYGFLWSYTYLGKKTNEKIKYQMPIKYVNIKQISVETNKIIETHPDALHAAKKLGLTNKKARCKIVDCINGKTNTAYGYKWTI